MNAPTNSDNVIDSRDVIDRITELEQERQDLVDADPHPDHDADLQAWDDDYSGELGALQSLAEEASDYSPDWTHGSTLILDSYFEDYARELAHDIGDVTDDEVWPHNCIDWERAANELKFDYTAVEFDGEDYWIR